MLHERRGPFRYWRDPVFAVCLAAYAVNCLLVKPSFIHLHEYSSFFQGHFDDTLTAPVAIPIFLWFYRVIGFRPDDEPPRLWEILLHMAVWTVFFKWYGPHILHKGVADPIDSLCMLGGGLVAWLAWYVLRRTNVPVRELR